MSDRAKTNLLKYGISTGIVIVLAGIYIGSRDFLNQTRMEQYRILCDAFTIPGLTLVLLGVLVWLSNEGALDAVSYAGAWLMQRLIPGGALRERETYLEYVERKRENRVTGYGFLFQVGGAAMAVALINMALFYRLYL